MNYLPAFIAPELVEALGWTILHSLWQGALIAITLSVLLILLHRHSARMRYAVATTALFSTLAIASVTFIRTYQEIQKPAPFTSPSTQVSPIVTEQPVSKPNPEITANKSTKPMLRGAILVNFKSYFGKHLPVVVLVWLLGMLTMLLKFLGGLAYVQRLKHYKTYSLGVTWNTRLVHMAQQLRVNASVRLFESTLVKSPLVIGYLKPIILLPFGTVAGLSPEQVEAILAHELAHIYRKDYLLNMLQTLVEILFFFNPAVWWMSDYVRVERENCCDDLAIDLCGNPLTYARALANLETISVNTPRLALAFAGKNGSLLGRIKRLVQQPRLRPTFSEGFMAACVLIIGLTVISASALAGFNVTAKAPSANSPAFVKLDQPKKVTPLPSEAEGNLKASIFSFTDSLSGKKSDLIIIKNKKGIITELYVDGQKIPQSNIADFRQEIEAAMAATRQVPRLKPTQVPQQLTKTKEALKKLELAKDEFSFSFSGDFDSFDKPLPAPKPVAALGAHPAVPSFPPLPAARAFPPFSPKKPLEYLKARNLPANTLYIIDGKKYPGKSGKTALNKLKNENISSLQIYHSEAAQKQYGEEGKDGVVVIKTGKNDPNNFLLQEIGDDNTNPAALRQNISSFRAESELARLAEEHNLRAQEQKERLKELETQMIARQQEHEARLKEHEIRVKEHEVRQREHEIRAKEHEEETARFEEIKKELVKDKLIDPNRKNLSIQINQDEFTVNGIKQPAAVYEKYKKLFFPNRKDWSGSFNHSINIVED